MAGAKRVSFDDEPLIVVDEHDAVLGYQPKADVHAGDGILHRAFSVFVFNGRGQLLMQQRSAEKPLWPLFWSNSCCSHPRRGETVDEAARRRLVEELGIEADPESVYTFQYHARYEDIGSERELCTVFLVQSDDEIVVNASEVAAIRWVDADALDAEMASDPDAYTPWHKMEWARLRADFADTLARYTDPA
ncbi:MAG: isopentenyl-diphosphate Delta-isomerase [Planctomycetota bacterium]|nr:isopentenyl-diphosphate Delta-isomerase [Planctomycetota bacterium]